MSQQHTVSESPGTAVPGNPAPDNAPAPSDVSGQISALTDAVNRLVQAQQQQPARAQQEQPVAPSSTADIGGDLPGGAALLPAVDVARLSPVQQIALGLRDAKPLGPAHPAVLHASGTAPRDGVAPDAPPVGAD